MVAITVTNDQPGVAARIACTNTGAVIPMKEMTRPTVRKPYRRGSKQSGYQCLRQAIATYGLTIKGGYLSDVELFDPNTYPAPPPLGPGVGPTPNVNTVSVGHALAFTAQATWSDGVTRPMLNADFDNMQGIWTSSNPNVMYISQQGQAIAIGPGTSSISFTHGRRAALLPLDYVCRGNTTNNMLLIGRSISIGGLRARAR